MTVQAVAGFPGQLGPECGRAWGRGGEEGEEGGTGGTRSGETGPLEEFGLYPEARGHSCRILSIGMTSHVGAAWPAWGRRVGRRPELLCERRWGRRWGRAAGAEGQRKSGRHPDPCPAPLSGGSDATERRRPGGGRVRVSPKVFWWRRSRAGGVCGERPRVSASRLRPQRALPPSLYRVCCPPSAHCRRHHSSGEFQRVSETLACSPES